MQDWGTDSRLRPASRPQPSCPSPVRSLFVLLEVPDLREPWTGVSATAVIHGDFKRLSLSVLLPLELLLSLELVQLCTTFCICIMADVSIRSEHRLFKFSDAWRSFYESGRCFRWIHGRNESSESMTFIQDKPQRLGRIYCCMVVEKIVWRKPYYRDR